MRSSTHMRPSLFAHEHAFGANLGKGQNLWVNKSVIEHQIRLTQNADRTQGQQVGRTRTGADEKNLAGSRRWIGWHHKLRVYKKAHSAASQ
jgi:hypothetical protein